MTEEEIVRRYSEQEMRCPTHLSIGQEACAVGVCMALEKSDRVLSTHRCHAHYLAKGGNLDAMIAELYGTLEGCSGGIGGSMHLADENVQMLGTSAVVGSSISVALGVALASKLVKANTRTVAFFGDAGFETGQFYECVNMAALWKLPILFVCENNQYSTQTPLSQRQPNRLITEVVESMGLKLAYTIKDYHVENVWRTTKVLLENLPAFLEINTYRYREHVGPNYDWDMGYRSEEEVQTHMVNDPLFNLENLLHQSNKLELLNSIVKSNQKLIDEAFEKATV